MARPLRVNLAGSWNHVVSRGNGGEALFRDDTDRRRFLGRVSELPERCSLEVCQRQAENRMKLAARGKVSLPDYLLLRVRYFADGAMLGTREYVEGVFQALRSRWGPSRTDGALSRRSPKVKAARPLQGLDTDLCVLRDLRKQVFE